MKKRLFLKLIVCAILAIPANAQTLKIQKIDRHGQHEIPTATQQAPTLASGMKAQNVPDSDLGINSNRLSKMNALEAEAGDNQDWIFLGTADYNEIFKIILQNNPKYFGDFTISPITVYFKPVSETVWDLKLSGFLNSDIYATTDFYNGITTFHEQAIGIKSPLYDETQPECFEYYKISETFNWTPFTDGNLEFPFILLISNNEGIPLTDYGIGISFDFGSYEHFGTAIISDNLVESLNATNFDVIAGPYEVGYKPLTNKIWLYQIKDFFGKDVPFISYNDAHHSVIPYVNTAYPTDFGEGYYEFFRLYSYFVGSPRDGEMPFLPWLNVSASYGYDFGYAKGTLTFTSDLISTFVMNIDNILAGPDQTSVTIPVEHSSNVTHSKVTVIYESINVEEVKYDQETIFDGDVEISSDNTITIELSKGRGAYSVKALGIDDVGVFGSTKSCIIVANTRDERQWETIGTGLFKPLSYRFCWPGETAPWLETEIEKVVGPESVYRMVNPFRRNEISEYGYESIDDMDFYIYFGEDADYSIIQASGLRSGDRKEYINYLLCYPAKNGSHGIDGRYDLSIGSITLPGVENYDIVFHSLTSATATPQVKSVTYAIIPASEGIRLNGGLDAAYWLDANVAEIKTLTPDAEGKVTFDRSEGKGEVNLLAVATCDQTGVRKGFKSSLSDDENGWYPVEGKVDIMAYGISGQITDLEQCEAEVRVNPFNRKIVQLVNPLKPFDGHILPEYGLESESESDFHYYTDFTNDHHIYFATTPNEQYDCVYSSDAMGNIVESGALTGLKGSNKSDYYDEYMLEYRLECSTNMLYRSGFTDDEISDFYTSKDYYPYDYNAYPYRCGSALIFPDNSSCFSSLAYGLNSFNSQYVIYAPTDFDRDYTLKAHADATITCGTDISKVKIYCVDSDQEPMSIKDVINSADIPTVVPDGDNSVRIAEKIGRYNYIAVGYDNNPDNAQPANVIFGTTDVTSGISDIDNNEDAPVEYYNLQGLRIDNPASGTIVIRRQGSITTKVLMQ